MNLDGGKGDSFCTATPLETGCPISRETPQNLRKGQKRMLVQKGARAVKHGRHSAPVRATRLAARIEEQRRSDEWMKTIPETDYGAIVDSLRALKRKEAATNR